MSLTAELVNPLREGIRLRRTPDPCAMVIFGASGDLTERKLIPALFYLSRERMLPPGFSVVGCARTPKTDEEFRREMAEAVKKFLHLTSESDALVDGFVKGLYYVAGDFSKPPAYEQLKQVLGRVDEDRGTAGNRLYYLSTPPSFFPVVVELLGESGLAKPQDRGRAWARIILEKPFGRSLESARELNRIVTRVFDEDQVYRIDHYLGKETVQNLLVFRFANGIFEPLWNRRYIDHVQIAVAEELGVENRGAYYEEAGLLRDMIQNHVLQLLSLVAMEPPATFQATAVRDEKAKVMGSLRPIRFERVPEFVVRGQYTEGFVGGKKVPAYRNEPKVAPTSSTETYAAFKFFIDNWRWADVPFYLRSGKRLPKRISEISIEFRRVPHLLFKGAGAEGIEPNILSMRIQPNEGISLKFCAKLPGTTMQIRPVEMEFLYGESFGATPPTAYETLLHDCMLGDATLFNRSDAVDLSWELMDPILERWQQDGAKGLALYPAGSWGPPEADDFIERDGRQWRRL
jgi:glucose-6-phosphate 1-dehydrogenase